MDLRIRSLRGDIMKFIIEAEQPDKMVKDELKLDTTGEYLTVGTKKQYKPSKDILMMAEIQYNHHLFTENAWFLLENADKIYKDSRMFLAPVKIQNGLAYTGTSGFWRPTVGVYLEWWLNYKDTSVDLNGNLIWYISGSPLTGSNCCKSVNKNGEYVKTQQGTSFSSIWRSFVEVNNRYTKAKQKCEAYTLEEVLIRLRGESYLFRIQELKHEMVMKAMEKENNHTLLRYYDMKGRYIGCLYENRNLSLQLHSDEILEFYNDFKANHEKLKCLESEFGRQHRELKEQLHKGLITDKEYKSLKGKASKDFKALKRGQSIKIARFIQKIFGKNPSHITPTDIIRYAEGKKLGKIKIWEAEN